MRTGKRGPRVVLTTSASYGIITANLTRSLKAAADKPQVARETAYYLDNIENVKSIDDFLADDRIFAYAMKAFGLGDMTYAKAFMRKVLSEGIDEQQQLRQQARRHPLPGVRRDVQLRRVRRHHHDFRRHRAGHRRPLRPPDAGRGCRRPERGRAAGPLFRAQGRRSDQPLRHPGRCGPAEGRADGARHLPATMSLLDIDKQAEMITARLDIEDLEGPGEARQVPQALHAACGRLPIRVPTPPVPRSRSASRSRLASAATCWPACRT